MKVSISTDKIQRASSGPLRETEGTGALGNAINHAFIGTQDSLGRERIGGPSSVVPSLSRVLPYLETKRTVSFAWLCSTLKPSTITVITLVGFVAGGILCAGSWREATNSFHIYYFSRKHSIIEDNFPP